jgi:cell division protein FtsI/penicillin-binding protein 2
VRIHRRAILLGHADDLDTLAYSKVVPVRTVPREKRRYQSNFHAARDISGYIQDAGEERRRDLRAVSGAEDDTVGDEGVAHAFV